MAIYFLHLKTFGRSGGSSAPSAAAYRAGERIRDERTGRTYDHTDRQDVMHKEIVLPARFAAADLGWATDRASLWNAAEAAETRKNARVAREYLVALPEELTPGQRLGLVRGFAQELSDRYRFAVDVAIHAPRDFPGSDPRNFHAHLLATTREVAPEGLAAKTTLELNDQNRRRLGLEPGIHELLHVRERWAAVTNEALRDAHVEARVDHRSLEAQGIHREARPWIPRIPYEMERRGYRSVVADRIREDQRARERAQQQTAALQRAAPDQRTAAEQRMGAERREVVAGAAAAPRSKPAMSLEDIRREARESWLRMRQESSDRTAPSAHDHARDDDWSR